MEWYAYLHENGSVQLKRCWEPESVYRQDFIGNSCVQRWTQPFEAETREEAMVKAEKLLGV